MLLTIPDIDDDKTSLAVDWKNVMLTALGNLIRPCTSPLREVIEEKGLIVTGLRGSGVKTVLEFILLDLGSFWKKDAVIFSEIETDADIDMLITLVERGKRVFTTLVTDSSKISESKLYDLSVFLQKRGIIILESSRKLEDKSVVRKLKKVDTLSLATK